MKYGSSARNTSVASYFIDSGFLFHQKNEVIAHFKTEFGSLENSYMPMKSLPMNEIFFNLSSVFSKRWAVSCEASLSAATAPC